MLFLYFVSNPYTVYNLYYSFFGGWKTRLMIAVTLNRILKVLAIKPKQLAE